MTKALDSGSDAVIFISRNRSPLAAKAEARVLVSQPRGRGALAARPGYVRVTAQRAHADSDLCPRSCKAGLMASSAKSGDDCLSTAYGRKARAPGRRGNVVRRSIVIVLMIEAPRVYAANEC